MLAGESTLMAGLSAAFRIFNMDPDFKHSLGLRWISPPALIEKFDIAFTGSDSLENPTMFAAMTWRTELLFEGV
jgi:hypothetical protein